MHDDSAGESHRDEMSDDIEPRIIDWTRDIEIQKDHAKISGMPEILAWSFWISMSLVQSIIRGSMSSDISSRWDSPAESSCIQRITGAHVRWKNFSDRRASRRRFQNLDRSTSTAIRSRACSTSVKFRVEIY